MKDENNKEIYIQFDLGDIDLPLRYNKCINLIEQARNNLKAQIVIINKKQDHKGKQLLSSNEVLKVKAFKQCYKEMEEAMDLFLGKGGTRKFLNGRNPLNREFNREEKLDVVVSEWLPEVSKCDNTDNGYAGIYGKAISGIRCKPQYGEMTVQAHVKGGNWLDKVSSKNYKKNDKVNSNSYAGVYGKTIDCIKISSSKGYVDYRVHTIEDGWLPWVNSKTKTGTESYAGIYGHTIDGVQMK